MLRRGTVRGVAVVAIGVGMSLALAQGLVGAQVPPPASDPLGLSGPAFEVTARLRGFQETPAISTRGRGDFKATVIRAGSQSALNYELSYANLEGTATAAHIHFGQRGVAGGISAFLCGGGGKPACPPAGTVTGTVTPADVIGPTGQGIEPGQFAELVRAMRAGITYANVHSNLWPAGEIRGQIRRVEVPPPPEEALDET